ncbi:AI-2E family transporter [Eggerthellaceae bacterium 3-80]
MSEVEDLEQLPETQQLVRNVDKSAKARFAFMVVWTVVGIIILTGVGIYVINILSVPVGIVLWTVVIVFCLRGIVNRLQDHGISRVIGTTIAYVVMCLVLFLIAVLMFSPAFGVGDQFNNLIQSIPTYISDITAWGNDLYNRYADVLSNKTVQEYLNSALSALGDWATNFAKNSASGVVAVGTGVANTFVAIGFALVIAFWVLMDLPAIGQECRRLVGTKHRDTFEMLHMTFSRVMGGYIKGTLLQCGVIGAGCAILFSVAGIPNGIALGGIAGILNIIPIVGPWLGGALAAVVGVFVSPWIALVALVGTIIIQQIVYTFVSPKIMSNSVDVHPALTFIALMSGSAIGGAMSGLVGSLVGMLVSIPAIAVMKSVFVYYFEKKTGRRIVAENGVFFKGSAKEDAPADPVKDATAPHPKTVDRKKK